MKRTRTSGGFSLIELIIAMALIAIVSAIAVPQLQRYSNNADLKTAAREIMGDFSEAKQRVVAENQDYRITLNVALNNYALSRSAPPAPWADVWLQPKLLASFGSGIRFDSVNYPGGVVNFQKRGTVSAGSLRLINRLGSRADITVNITGRTYVQFTMQ